MADGTESSMDPKDEGREAISHNIRRCVSVLKQQNRIPQTQMGRIIDAIADLANEYDDHSLSELVLAMVKQQQQQSKLSGKYGAVLLAQLFDDIASNFLQAQQSPLVSSRDKLSTLITILDHLVYQLENLDGLNIADDNGVDQLPNNLVENMTTADDWDKILTSTNYIAHFVGIHKDFASRVVVIAWKSSEPGPTMICHNGMPVLYVHHQSAIPDFVAWGGRPPPQRSEYEGSSEDLSMTRHIRSIIEVNNSRLFNEHPNIVTIRCSKLTDDNKRCIEFVVLCKNFLPCQDDKPTLLLPSKVGGIATCVSQGWTGYCGFKEREKLRPLRPGAGFSIDKDAKFELCQGEPVLGTIGGFYVKRNTVYGVTCGHCIRSDTKGSFYPPPSEVFQPCAMGLLMNAAHSGGYIQGYETLKGQQGQKYAMDRLIGLLSEDIPNFSTSLPDDASCATVHSHILGPLPNNVNVNVDVGLLKLNEGVGVDPTCLNSVNFPVGSNIGQPGPSLVLGDVETPTPLVDIDDFQNNPTKFRVYGSGAYSAGRMEVLVDPTTCMIEHEVNGTKFSCIQARVTQNWHAGDSGTWCWTNDGQILGMGFGFLYGEEIGDFSCLILPMSVVVTAIEHLLGNPPPPVAGGGAAAESAEPEQPSNLKVRAEKRKEKTSLKFEE